MYRILQKSDLIILLTHLTILSRAVDGGEVHVEVKPSAMSIQVDDPLFVKVLIENKSKKLIRFDRELGTIPGTLMLQVRSPGHQKYLDIVGRLQGAGYGGLAVLKKRSLSPGERFVCYEVLLSKNGRESVFSQPGIYRIRARIMENDGIEGTSNDLEIVARNRIEEERRAIREYSRFLRTSIGPGGIPNSTTIAELDEIRGKLSDSLLKTTLEWMALVLQIRDVKAMEDFEETSMQLSMQMKQVDPITRDVVSILLAREWTKKRQYKKATEEIGRIRGRNYHSNDVRLTIVNLIWEEELHQKQAGQKK